jgi:hypothetical protein
MTTGADGGAAITSLLGHPDHRSGYGTTKAAMIVGHCSASRVFRTWMSVGWLGVAWRRSAGRSAASGRVLGFVECL